MELGKTAIWLYGQPMSGKSTWAGQLPKAAVLSLDGNAKFNRKPDGTPLFAPEDIYEVSDIDELREKYTEIVKSKKYETLLIDTVDILADWIRYGVLEDQGIDDESQGGQFGLAWRLVREGTKKYIVQLIQKFPGTTVLISWEDELTETDRLGREVTTFQPSLMAKLHKDIAGLSSMIIRAKKVQGKSGKVSYALSFGDEPTEKLVGSRIPIKKTLIPATMDAFYKNFGESSGNKDSK
jgi:hypothetical protein